MNENMKYLAHITTLLAPFETMTMFPWKTLLFEVCLKTNQIYICSVVFLQMLY